MKQIVISIFLLSMTLSFGQVLDGNNPAVQAALANTQFEGSPLANYFQRRTPAMDQLMRDVRNNGTTQNFYIGPQKGSAYENEDFAQGKVYHNDEFLDNVYYRYNAFSDEIEVKKTKLKEEQYLALLKNEDIYLISNSGKKYIYREFFDEKGNVQNGYLVPLKLGKEASLYKQYSVKFVEGKKAENSMVNPIPNRFIPTNRYLVKNEQSKKIVQLPSKKKKLFKFLEKNNKGFDAKKYEKEDIDLNSDLDMINLFNNIY